MSEINPEISENYLKTKSGFVKTKFEKTGKLLQTREDFRVQLDHVIKSVTKYKKILFTRVSVLSNKV